jgi:ABC-type Fe3+/spermidine/putrescine transport system ATPase subunit
MNSEIKQGERIILAIRPETCEIKKGHNNAENALFGKIEKMTFEGTNIRYEIRLDNGDRMIINRPSLTEEWIKVGEEVTITYPLEKTHLFLYPEAGLTEEISV